MLSLSLRDRLQIKVSLYMMSVLAEDLTTQRDGAVCLYYFPTMEFGGGGDEETPSSSSSSSSTRTATSATITLEMVQHENRRLLDAMPLRFTGVHLCLHNPVSDDNNSDEKSPRQSRVELSALGLLGDKEKMYTRIHAGECVCVLVPGVMRVMAEETVTNVTAGCMT
jgi:hypothetical protein